MVDYSSKALSIIMLSLLATFAVAYAIPQTVSPLNNSTNPPPFNNQRAPVSGTVSTYLNLIQHPPQAISTTSGPGTSFSRSEERRVGKECRSRVRRYHIKK